MTVTSGEPHYGAAPRVLLLVTDPRLREEVAADLRGAGFAVVAPTALDQAVVLAEAFGPQVIVTGHCIRTSSHDVPFTAIPRTADRSTMVLVAPGDQEATIAAFNAGADDVMSLPLSVEELTARCQALVRRARRPHRRPSSTSTQSVVRFGALCLDLGLHEVRVRGQEVAVTRIELALLERLCRRSHEVCTRVSLLRDVWGSNWIGARHIVDVHLSNLHRKLRRHAPDLCFIHTVRGVGFRLGDDLFVSSAA